MTAAAGQIVWQVGDERSLTHTFTRHEIEVFARLTGDTNPLHVDAEFANRSSAAGQVVHGMLAASFVSTLIGVHIPGRGALWNSFEVSWRKMIRIGDTLRFHARVKVVQVATRTLDMEISGVHAATGEIYLEGKARVMIMQERSVDHASPLTGKRVLVTGASGEVGAAICKRLATAGCRLVTWGRNFEKLERLAGALRESSESFHTIDLLDDDALTAGLADVTKRGRIDGIVHAAAAPLKFADVGDASNRQYLHEHWRIDVAALQRLAQELAPGMERGAFIIAVLTQAILDTPPPKMSAYVVAKTGAWGLVRALAAELGAKGVRCNAVSPGLIDTPYVKDMSLRVKQVEAAGNPLRRLCTVEDVADAVHFLAGPDASYLNGVNLPVTGGARMP